ncbi:L-azetidine-2-carboxylic acid acetyltransferase [Acrasis kona]|uniref:L-azetidine-2-carboxylic acid acetyltransferase n=1 Tax=Acrasis kona TaxID=1008807 RepID=A0AAW2Z8E0_9EUKA
MSSAYGTISTPTSVQDVSSLLPIKLESKGNHFIFIDRVDQNDEEQLSKLHEMLNHEIRNGNSYPQEAELTREQWKAYFLSAEAFVSKNEEGEVMGTFYIKPNFPGRCSHICNGGFITAINHRRKGAAKAMAQAFLILAPALGYKASMFNLVFETNVASVELWKSLNFQQIGRVPNAGRLKNARGEEQFVDALIFYNDFQNK